MAARAQTQAGQAEATEDHYYVCDHPGCGKRYRRAEHRTRHQLNHKGISVVCDICGKQFTRNDLLNRHKARHQQRNEFAPGDAQAKQSKAGSSGDEATGQRKRRKQGDGADSDRRSLRSASPLMGDVTQPPLLGSALGHASNQTYVPVPTLIHNMDAPQPLGGAQADVFPSAPQYQPANQFAQSNGAAASAVWQSLGMTSVAAGPDYSMLPPPTAQGPLQRSVPQPTMQMPVMDLTPHALETDSSWNWLYDGNGVFDEPFSQLMDDADRRSASGCTDTSVPGQTSESSLSKDPLELASFKHSHLIHELPQELHTHAAFSIRELKTTLQMAFDSLDATMPIFHRASLTADSLSSVLLLTLLSYGFLIQISKPDICQLGLQLHHIARRKLYDPDVAVRNVDLMFLQAMLLHEITGSFLATRPEHEKADVLHGQLIALARRSNFLAIDSSDKNGRRLRTAEKWQDFIKRESIKRLASAIYINDVQQTFLFNHIPLMTVEDMKIAIPCSDALWRAESATSWTACQASAPTGESNVLVRELVACFINDNRRQIDNVRWTAFSRYLVLHGLMNVISMHADRRSANVMLSHCDPILAQAPHMAKTEREALSNALNLFDTLQERSRSRTYPFLLMRTTGQEDRFLEDNTRILFRLARISIDHYGPDMEIQAGAIFSSGRAVSHNRAAAAAQRLLKKKFDTVTVEAALATIQQACETPDWADKATAGALTSAEMMVPTCCYIAGLVLWTFVLCLKRESNPLDPSSATVRGPEELGPLLSGKQTGDLQMQMPLGQSTSVGSASRSLMHGTTAVTPRFSAPMPAHGSGGGPATGTTHMPHQRNPSNASDRSNEFANQGYYATQPTGRLSPRSEGLLQARLRRGGSLASSTGGQAMQPSAASPMASTPVMPSPEPKPGTMRLHPSLVGLDGSAASRVSEVAGQLAGGALYTAFRAAAEQRDVRELEHLLPQLLLAVARRMEVSRSAIVHETREIVRGLCRQ